MPTYEYACRSCGEHLEAVQKFTDDALTECPRCGGSLRKVFGNVGIAFKGSGFYKNDSRSTTSSSKTSSSSTSSESSSSSSSSSSEGSGSNGSSAGAEKATAGSSSSSGS